MRFHNRNRSSLLCPRCRRLISIDEPRCPHCGLTKPGSVIRGMIFNFRLRNPEQLVQAIVTINIVMFVLSLILHPGKIGLSAGLFSFLSPDPGILTALGGTGTIPVFGLGRWWSLITANYLHGGLLHIFFNMMALRQLAPLVIAEYGSSRFLVIYTLGGVAGFALSVFFGVRETIGASASVCALVGALLYFGKSRGGAYGNAVYSQIAGWASGTFLFGLMMPGINNWAHIGGMAAGAMWGWLLGYRERTKESQLHVILAYLCAGGTIFFLGWAVLITTLALILVRQGA